MRSLSIAILAAALFVSSPVVAQSERPEGEKPSTEEITAPAPLRAPSLLAKAEPVVRYPVQITGEKGATVSIAGASCSTPCQLSIPPGQHDVQVSGGSSFWQQVDFPTSSSTLIVEFERSDLKTLGTAGILVGVPLVIFGPILINYALVESPKNDPCNSNRTVMECYDTDFVLTNLLLAGLGIVATATGVIAVAVLGGVGFGLMGKDRLVLQAPRVSTSDDEPPVRLVGLAAAPVRGGAMLGATFVF